jgi:hypothetical protein
MNSQQLQFLNLRNFPARLSAEEAAWYPGFSPHQIPVLVSAGLLKPLGQPVPSSTLDWFHSNQWDWILLRIEDWLGKFVELLPEKETDRTASNKGISERTKSVVKTLTDLAGSLLLHRKTCRILKRYRPQQS